MLSSCCAGWYEVRWLSMSRHSYSVIRIATGYHHRLVQTHLWWSQFLDTISHRRYGETRVRRKRLIPGPSDSPTGSSSLTSSSRMHQTNSETQKNHMRARYTTSVTKMVQTARKPVANFLFRLKWINGGISIRSGESRFAAAAASLTPFELLWSALSFETDSVCNSKERRVRKLRIYSFNGL